MQKSLTLLKKILLMALKMLCQSAYAQMLLVHICCQGHLLTLNIPLHSQCFPGNLLASETNLNVLQCSSVDILISWRLLCIKAGQRLCMVFQYLIWQVVYRFTVPRNILQWDLMLWDQQFEEMLCEIFVSMSQ